MRRYLIAVVSLATLPAILHAQGRGMMPGTAVRPVVSAPAPHTVIHASPSPGAHTTATPRMVAGTHYVRTRSGLIIARPTRTVSAPVRTTGSIGTSRPLLSQDVPGLGFDYTHFALTHPQSVNARNRNSLFVGAYFPFFGGGYYTPLFPDDVEEAPAVEAQQVDTGEPEPPAGRSRYSDSSRDYAAQNYPPAPQPTPKGESEEYVFVRRDGSVFFAVAYAWESGSLRYVTNEGVRHIVASDKLDLDATQQFNEQRGLNFRSPAA